LSQPSSNPQAHAEDEDRAYQARQLTLTLRLSFAALMAGTLISALAGYQATLGPFLTLFPILLAMLLARRGRLRAASLVLVLSMLGLETWLLQNGYGLQDIGLIMYPVIVLLAGLLFGRRLFVLAVVLSLASLYLVTWGQLRGHVKVLNEVLRPDLVIHALIASLVVCVAATIVHLVATDLRRSLKAVHLSEQRYRLISEVSSDYTFSSAVDEQGRVRPVWVAGALERMTGYGFEEYRARGGWRATLHPDDLEQDDRDLQTLRANRPVVSTLRTLTRGGEVRFVRVYAHPVWSRAEDRLVGIYGAVQDVTDAQQAHDEREALIGRLEAKNAELERFTYTVSHDLKSPLVTIRGFLGFLEQDALEGDLERFAADAERIRQATERMTRLMDELLELSRVGRTVKPPEPIAFDELAREAVALLAAQVGERGAKVEIAEGLPQIHGDRARLRQVVQNLVENSVKFLGDQQEPRVEVGARPGPGGPVLYVRDNGIGIEPRYHERVFGVFDKLDPESPGTGVGLSLVHRIVEQHGGRAWVESEGPGQGTTVCFTLAPPPEVLPAPGDLPATPAPGHPPSTLAPGDLPSAPAPGDSPATPAS
jgi:PAS domain S-box-containing protein